MHTIHRHTYVRIKIKCQQVIRDYSTPAGKSLSRDLTSGLNSIINFLVDCRPLSVSMGNAIKFLKMRISKVGRTIRHKLIADLASPALS